MATSIPENAVATFATELKKYEGFVPVTSLNASIVNSFYGAVSPVAPLGRARLMGCAKHGDNYSIYLMWTRRWGRSYFNHSTVVPVQCARWHGILASRIGTYYQRRIKLHEGSTEQIISEIIKMDVP